MYTVVYSIHVLVVRSRVPGRKIITASSAVGPTVGSLPSDFAARATVSTVPLLVPTKETGMGILPQPRDY